MTQYLGWKCITNTLLAHKQQLASSGLLLVFVFLCLLYVIWGMWAEQNALELSRRNLKHNGYDSPRATVTCCHAMLDFDISGWQNNYSEKMLS